MNVNKFSDGLFLSGVPTLFCKLPFLANVKLNLSISTDSYMQDTCLILKLYQILLKERHG